MSNKYYKVLKDTFLWEKGAILKYDETAGASGGYEPINDIWSTEANAEANEYITAKNIENNPEWFERVYAVNLITKTVYKSKAEARELMEKEYSGRTA